MFKDCLIIKCDDIDIVNDICEELESLDITIGCVDGKKIIISEDAINESEYTLQEIKREYLLDYEIDGFCTFVRGGFDFKNMTYDNRY